jgi:hypothetical protein
VSDGKPEIETAGTGVFEAFIAVQQDIGAIGKNKRVTEGPARFNFRGVDDVMDALHDPMARRGLICVPQVQERIPETRHTRNGGVMNVVHLRVRFAFYGPDGSTFAAEGWGEGQDSGDKATGKAHSMAYKSALLQAFHIPVEGTPDADTDTTPAAPAPKVTDPTWLDEFDKRMTAAGSLGEVRSLWGELTGKHAAGAVSDIDLQLLRDALTARGNELKTEDEQ